MSRLQRSRFQTKESYRSFKKTRLQAYSIIVRAFLVIHQYYLPYLHYVCCMGRYFAICSLSSFRLTESVSRQIIPYVGSNLDQPQACKVLQTQYGLTAANSVNHEMEEMEMPLGSPLSNNDASYQVHQYVQSKLSTISRQLKNAQTNAAVLQSFSVCPKWNTLTDY